MTTPSSTTTTAMALAKKYKDLLPILDAARRISRNPQRLRALKEIANGTSADTTKTSDPVPSSEPTTAHGASGDVNADRFGCTRFDCRVHGRPCIYFWVDNIRTCTTERLSSMHKGCEQETGASGDVNEGRFGDPCTECHIHGRQCTFLGRNILTCTECMNKGALCLPSSVHKAIGQDAGAPGDVNEVRFDYTSSECWAHGRSCAYFMLGDYLTCTTEWASTNAFGGPNSVHNGFEQETLSSQAGDWRAMQTTAPLDNSLAGQQLPLTPAPPCAAWPSPEHWQQNQNFNAMPSSDIRGQPSSSAALSHGEAVFGRPA